MIIGGHDSEFTARVGRIGFSVVRRMRRMGSLDPTQCMRQNTPSAILTYALAPALTHALDRVDRSHPSDYVCRLIRPTPLQFAYEFVLRFSEFQFCRFARSIKFFLALFNMIVNLTFCYEVRRQTWKAILSRNHISNFYYEVRVKRILITFRSKQRISNISKPFFRLGHL
ncbi:hypothetical protein DF3PA_40119 [Candidatus Defluviicoccus seviourii]|uniref:Uncharacterized protein n=2 Tax=root TaxID=1 RepID=A0A564WI36_9PROT|nr:hypothetical protein DF3PB_2000003 [uncultured Defluviicoccus sp.]VUX47243.1 hypothetical protein DF3PA_40119 [Candidatus Defluviicoccus seviourii]